MSPSRADLVADCSRCVGLCCVVPAFAPSADFALDKPAGVPCPHLGLHPAEHFGCTIHTELPERGFAGCTVYDCFGAGQRVAQAPSYAGHDWRDPDVRPAMFADFEVVERLHELQWYLLEAVERCPDPALVDEAEGLLEQVERAAASPRDVEVVRLQLRADPLLGEVSDAVREPAGVDLRGHDLAGQDLRGHDLVAATLRGAVLLGADLRGVDLTGTDLLGADLRGADLRGADASGALFWTRLQLRAARTDTTTRLPDLPA
ncbi:Pentapeptide repeat-containing protein [Nocardioides scoriae]|uniref:Pentapeptide repeat-containing protein n=1 Tax=Nocardioides scoriae TaxID=642780 RepID=A0A1H1W1A3_9ACTN|nr:pentapeptide repeat-containing protein [Nocardioides scoriae]SDS90813.1 Pentapeptide repeat-containing protein [Nocardioides scoriae]